MNISPGALTADKILEINDQIQVTSALLTGAFKSELARLEKANTEFKQRKDIVDTLDKANALRAEADVALDSARAEAKAMVEAATVKAKSIEKDVAMLEVRNADADTREARIKQVMAELETRETNFEQAIAAREALIASREADLSARQDELQKASDRISETQAKLTARLKALEAV